MSHWDEQDRVLALVVDTVVGPHGSTGQEGGPVLGPQTGQPDAVASPGVLFSSQHSNNLNIYQKKNNLSKQPSSKTRNNFTLTTINSLTNPLSQSDNTLETVINRADTSAIRRFECSTDGFNELNICTRIIVPPRNIIHTNYINNNINNKNKRKFIDILEGSNKKVKNINDKIMSMARAMTPAWSMRLLSVSCGSVVCAWGLLLVLSVLGGGASHGTGEREYGFDNVGNMEDLNGARCPWACSCVGQDLDCSERGLTQVPGDLAVLAEKL